MPRARGALRQAQRKPKNQANKFMIKKINGKYIVLSETTGRRFGTYNTLEEAKKRLRQIEFFKHLKIKKK